MIVDASLVVAGLCEDLPHGAWAREVLAQSPLIAPQGILPETANALRRLERTGKLSTSVATHALRDLLKLPIQLVAFEPFADRAWSLRANVSIHDAWYVAVAEAFGYPVATLDRRLSRASGPTCEFLLPD